MKKIKQKNLSLFPARATEPNFVSRQMLVKANVTSRHNLDSHVSMHTSWQKGGRPNKERSHYYQKITMLIWRRKSRIFRKNLKKLNRKPNIGNHYVKRKIRIRTRFLNLTLFQSKLTCNKEITNPHLRHLNKTLSINQMSHGPYYNLNTLHVGLRAQIFTLPNTTQPHNQPTNKIISKQGWWKAIEWMIKIYIKIYVNKTILLLNSRLLLNPLWLRIMNQENYMIKFLSKSAKSVNKFLIILSKYKIPITTCNIP